MPKAQITGAASARESRNKNLNLLFMFVETDEEKELKLNISQTGRNTGDLHTEELVDIRKPNRNRRHMKRKH